MRPIPVRRVTPASAARRVFRRIADSLRRRGSCSLVLAGGATPRPVYAALGALLAGRVDPAALFFFLGDERAAERGAPELNETMVRESLFGGFQPREENVFFWDALPVSPEESAARYEKKIDDYFIGPGRTPDLVLLGLGPDGHAAALFPGALAVAGDRRLPLAADTPGTAAAVYLPDRDAWRLSLTAAFLRAGRETLFLVSGEGKAGALCRLAARDPELPASWAAAEKASIFMVR